VSPQVRRVRDVLDPGFLGAQLRRVQASGQPALTDEHYAAALEELRRAAAGEPGAPPPGAFFPRTPALAILQSTLETCLRLRAPDVLQPAAGAGSGSRLPDLEVRPDVDIYRPFGPCDPGWINSKLAEGIRLLEGRPSFPDRPADTVALADDARVVLVGDWGTGLPAAEDVGRQMGRELAEAAGRDRHVIHLGDVYYSGWREEYAEHFLPYWPHAAGDPTIRSWALNGNHDMYSGGHGYFGYLLRDARFTAQQESSHFRLAGRHWQVLALDTAYEDHDLAGSQADWVRDQVAGAGLRTVLLTHHQPLSAYVTVPGTLRDRLAPALAAARLDAWFWGHEHRCALYDETERVRWPRCVGHGGVPILVPPEAAPLPPGVRYEYRGAEVIGPDRWGLFGFVVLDFDGPSLRARYVNERGEEHYREEQ
jgi:hypothetical protein